ncbi:hypothetical protein GCM10008171_06560 [Methylopila jiangsuensis]|uniref:BrnA antitoxin of type II toxin-antitoxin system n=1 Tax=Methylopila jiangsuensis TaxID=586230 RepID=A0A9W6N2U6_9HYPH|nr:BrnA antitoxin family protein [Methylopila jiangsuensis]MDR6285643.1 uncharacterized protein (DUF4415 family) [Methylopila jiangsuensis]GLK75402.1 hypothetical protein GCM10008171_06560 [Methylopila jiangsuensis]
MSRRPQDPRAAAEAVFRSRPPAAPTAPSAPAAAPGAREQVTLRIDVATLEHFQNGGRGWQDRINDALREHVRAEGGLSGEPKAIPADRLSSENDDGAG